MRKTLVNRMVDDALKAVHKSIEVKALYVLSDIQLGIVKERLSLDAIICKSRDSETKEKEVMETIYSRPRYKLSRKY